MTNLSLQIQRLSFAYGEQLIIKNWSGSIESGQLIHLSGANGSGKTTLLRLIAKILKPDHGSILYDCHCAYVGHQLGLHPDLTVMENLSVYFNLDNTSVLDNLLMEANLFVYRFTHCRKLSVGQKQKLAFIRMVLSEAPLWIMDEPFANLDHQGESWMWGYIEKHICAGGIFIFTAHQRDFSTKGAIQWQL
jgi:heme exporter protein A